MAAFTVLQLPQHLRKQILVLEAAEQAVLALVLALAALES